jgi:hypothetical protein
MATASSTALVADAALTAQEGSQFGGIVATFTDPGGPEALSDYSAAINWGDGHTSVGTVASDGSDGFNVMGTNVLIPGQACSP